jgi:hypothetical protein
MGGWLSGNFPSSMSAMIEGTDGKGVNSFRPVQTLYTGEVANRSQGNDIGYDPSWLTDSETILRNNNQRSRDDSLHNAAGNLSASGLSGNPKAYQATSGKIQRNSDTDLQNSLAMLNIENMQQKANDKNYYTGLLGSLNSTNISQEDAAANADLNEWKGQESAMENRQNSALDAASMFRSPYAVGLQSQGSNLSSQGSSLSSMNFGSNNNNNKSSSASSLGGGGGQNYTYQGSGLLNNSSAGVNNDYQNYLSAKYGKNYNA